MEKEEIIQKITEITTQRSTIVSILPGTIKKCNRKLYTCILDRLKEKSQNSQTAIEKQDIKDFQNSNLSIGIELMDTSSRAAIKEVSLIKGGEKILILHNLMNINIKSLIEISKELAEEILIKLQKKTESK